MRASSRQRSALKEDAAADTSFGLTDSFLMRQKVEDVASKIGQQALGRASSDLRQLRSEAVYLEQ